MSMWYNFFIEMKQEVAVDLQLCFKWATTKNSHTQRARGKPNRPELLSVPANNRLLRSNVHAKKKAHHFPGETLFTVVLRVASFVNKFMFVNFSQMQTNQKIKSKQWIPVLCWKFSIATCNIPFYTSYLRQYIFFLLYPHLNLVITLVI